MKKIILLVGFLVLTTSGTVKVSDNGYSSVIMKTYVINDMTYAVFFAEANSGSYQDASPCVINVTKDQLECSYYRKQLKR